MLSLPFTTVPFSKARIEAQTVVASLAYIPVHCLFFSIIQDIQKEKYGEIYYQLLQHAATSFF
jgi:hypothetical protein